MPNVRSLSMLLVLSVAALATSACVAVPARTRLVYHQPGHVWVPAHWQHGVWVRGHWRR